MGITFLVPPKNKSRDFIAASVESVELYLLP